MENLTKKHKQIIGAVAAVLVVVIVGAIALTVGGKNNDEPTVVVEENTFGTIKLEYGVELEDENFTIVKDGEDVLVTIEGVDTKKMGDTNYDIKVDDKDEVITVRIEDTQNPVIAGEEAFEITLGDTIDLNEKLKASDPVDGVLELDFTLPELTEVEDYKVVVTAQDANGNKVSKTVVISVLKKVEVVEEPADKPTANKPADKPVNKPADKPVNKPADKPVNKPADKPAAVEPEVIDTTDPNKADEPDPIIKPGADRVYVSSKKPDDTSGFGEGSLDWFYVSLKLSDGATIQEVVVSYKTTYVMINGKTSDGKSFHFGNDVTEKNLFHSTSEMPNLSDNVVNIELPAIAAQYRAYYRAV